ncbi:MAG: hypothetical protein WAQ22_02625 [Candidatus Saccharimonas sp.]
MNSKPVTQEELELAIQSFEQMGGMVKYAEIMERAMNMMRDHFDMTERSLTMVQKLHVMRLQGIDQWVGLCKFLLPLFATIATVGLTITSPTFNSQIATAIGLIGFVVFFAGLFELSRKRQKILAKQEKDIEKLHKAFQDGQELVDILKVQAQNERGEMTDEKVQDMMKRILRIKERGV